MSKKMIVSLIIVLFIFCIILILNIENKNIKNELNQSKYTNVYEYYKENDLYIVKDIVNNEIIKETEDEAQAKYYTLHPDYNPNP